jgi:RND family efflux transporter MFP subunit
VVKYFKNKWLWIIGVLFGIVMLTGLERLEQIQARQNRPVREPKPLIVGVVPAKLGPISQWILGQGTVRVAHKASLYFESAGKVTALGLDASGQAIREGSQVWGPIDGHKHGQLLASLDQREQIEVCKQAEAALIDAKHQVKAALGNMTKAKNDLDLIGIQYGRSKRLFEKKALSLVELQKHHNELLDAKATMEQAVSALEAAKARIKAAQAEAEKARLSLERTSIFAPFDGVIARLNIREGEYFRPDQIDNSSQQALLSSSPITIIDPGTIEMSVHIPYYEGYLVKPGQKVVVQLNDLQSQAVAAKEQDKLLSGTVYSVSPLLSPSQRTIRVIVRFQQEENHLLDGMFISCWIQVRHNPLALLIPVGSLLFEDDQPYIYVSQQGKAQKRSIELGILDEKQVEVVKGIEPDELLITRGRHLLFDGRTIRHAGP